MAGRAIHRRPVKPPLVLGLGNALAGDDGIGAALVTRLTADPRLPPGTEVAWGGTDLLRWGAELRGRERVVLVDAFLDEGGEGVGEAVRVLDPRGRGAGQGREHAHHLSPLHALDLLCMAAPELRCTPMTLVSVGVTGVRVGAPLSREADRRLDRVLEAVLEALR